MVIDIATERGLMHLGDKWGSSTICHFPLFDFLQPLTLKWMFVVYSIMLFGKLDKQIKTKYFGFLSITSHLTSNIFVGAIGLLLGFGYRLCSCAFLITYWYIFLLDTTAWNNHSYLFGLLGSLLAISGAGQYW